MAIIRLGLRFPTGSSSLPGNYGGPPWRTSIEASPYRARPLGGAAFPYLALLHVGFAKPIRYRTAGALLPHLFTLTGKFRDVRPRISRRYVFCGTLRPLRALALRGTLPCGVRTFLGEYAAIARLPANLMILCSLANSAIGEAGGSEIPLVV